ncbi:Protein arginine N-methyltransferase 1 [Phytophthora cinnamomi]|uniref:Protein arginine N-methyltransferase 1 n=1 Tax=Phytophthora cinnamomi TaxID=4785 RepID=UPI003559738C|nr:Protein arginine N-methyltransferase 1 [Phytophthora cinnamomi]
MFKGLVVLDVDYGTGILSMIAAKAGTKHVYDVGCSGILTQAREIVKANGFADKITLTQSKMHELTLPVDKVDIIISKWMGYFVLYESMLETVLNARNKYLVPGGLMFPDHSTTYIGAIDDGEYKTEKLDFWENVYVFDMSCIKNIAKIEPLVDTVGSDALLSDVCPHPGH